MITRNPMQFKAIIKNKAKEKNISAQLVMQNYMLERLLERISLSPYRHNFILKGGFLIAAVVGLGSRTTMDMDTTIKGFTLSHESIKKIFEEVCNIPVDDDITFEVSGVADIRETDDYPGIRVNLMAKYSPINVPLTVDVTTGDVITPKEIEFTFPMMFDDRNLSVLAYNLETVVAEKIETVLSRSIANTRPRDFYDIYIIYTLHREKIDFDILRRAFEKTIQKRGSNHILRDYSEILGDIQNSKEQFEFWKKYQKNYSYVNNISFADTCDVIEKIMDELYGGKCSVKFSR